MKKDNLLLYRFRPIKFYYSKNNKIVTKTVMDELDNQEIFFGTTSENNDPMDGSQFIYWEGDEILWKNLVYHYSLCFFDTIQITQVIGNTGEIDSSLVRAWLTPEDLDTNEYRDNYELLKEYIDKNNSIKLLIILLTRRKRISISVLESLLTLFMNDFIKIINDFYKDKYKRKIFPFDTSIVNTIEDKNISDILLNAENDELFDKISSLSNQRREDIKFTVDYNNYTPEDDDYYSKRNYSTIISSFPKMYVDACKKVTYPEYYLASFSKKNNNCSMWGHYSSGHRGICIIFKPIIKNNDYFLRINDKDIKIFDVDYSNNPPKINFFLSLGMIRNYSIHNFWMRDGDNFSSVVSHYDDTFHKNYWDNYYKKISHKFDDWEVEQELRAVTTSYSDKIDKLDRIYKYDFKNVVGIIFGMSTPDNYKYEITKIIEKKCRLYKRNDFKFYQSEYDELNHEMLIREMKNMKFNQEKVI